MAFKMPLPPRREVVKKRHASRRRALQQRIREVAADKTSAAYYTDAKLAGISANFPHTFA